MRKREKCMKTLLCRLACRLVAACFALAVLPTQAASSAPTNPISLMTDVADFRVHTAKFLGEDDKVCLAGRFLKDDAARNDGRLMVLDAAKGKLVWDKTISPPSDAMDISFVDCVRHGNQIYAAANVKLASKQMMVWLYQFDQQGKQLAAKALEVEGDNVLADALHVVDGALMVSGMAQTVSAKEAKEENYALFLSKLDANLQGETRVIKKGGFRNGATMKWVGKNLLLAGYFLPQKLAKTDLVNDYANAKMSLAGNYVWSVRPQAPNAEGVASAVDSLGSVFSLAAQRGTSTLSVVDSSGKLLAKNAYPSAFCDTLSMTALDVNLLAVRKPCDAAKQRTRLVLIDKKSAKEMTPDVGKQEPILVFSQAGRWGLLSQDEKGILSLQFGKSNHSD